MLQRAQALSDTLVALRRDIHRHPGLSFQQDHTARLIARRLAELDLPARTGVGKTGVVAGIAPAGSRAFPDTPRRLHHHPRFDVDERCLPVGAALLAETALRYLRTHSPS
jgi:metal-dependent amidase/aminoacylase/carboxypeptidase family protein